jgi:hypothetical protein
MKHVFSFKIMISQSNPASSTSSHNSSPLVILQQPILSKSSQPLQSTVPQSLSPGLSPLPLTPKPTIRVYHRRINTTSTAATMPISDSTVSTHHMLTRS